jgi:membrane associated rhomboid family serine protease
MSIRWIPTYNAPVVLTFALMALVVRLVDAWAGGMVAPAYFAALPEFDYKSFWSWFRLVSHVLGHKDTAHLASNFAVILLIGPVLEEKHGGKPLAVMIFATALITGVLNTLFFNSGLMGASGVVFMMILLGSFVNHRPGEIPMTFLAVTALYLAGEVSAAFAEDGVSQFAHILGGLCGTVFGFWKAPGGKGGSGSRRMAVKKR